jgi:hypothetical protein
LSTGRRSRAGPGSDEVRNRPGAFKGAIRVVGGEVPGAGIHVEAHRGLGYTWKRTEAARLGVGLKLAEDARRTDPILCGKTSTGCLRRSVDPDEPGRQGHV